MAYVLAERVARRVRLGLATFWAVILVSLLYDPFTPVLTTPDGLLTRLEGSGGNRVMVQGQIVESLQYPLGAPLFWGLLLPLLVAVVFLFGHELWRRICPLSFFSQLGRIGRRRVSWLPLPAPQKVARNSFLERHHTYLQLVTLYVALCCRILFVNSERTALFLFFLFFITAAVIVGFVYDGKSWCQYFCPVSPVEEFYSGPRGLLSNPAHLKATPRIRATQSMCRSEEGDPGLEASTCVGCASTCIDIDSEKHYWRNLMTRSKGVLYYGYAGLVISYFFFYLFYAGNWWYYLSGIWAHEPGQLDHLLSPGFYMMGSALPIPKLLAVPLTLGVGVVAACLLGFTLERVIHANLLRRGSTLTRETVRHRMLSVTTFLIFNFYFIFSGHNVLHLLPVPLPTYAAVALGCLSSVWLMRTWPRSEELYREEASRHQIALREMARSPQP